MGSSENRANSENLIHTGGLQVPDIGWGCTKVGEFSCYFSNPPAQRLPTLVSHSEANPKNNWMRGEQACLVGRIYQVRYLFPSSQVCFRQISVNHLLQYLLHISGIFQWMSYVLLDFFALSRRSMFIARHIIQKILPPAHVPSTSSVIDDCVETARALPAPAVVNL